MRVRRLRATVVAGGVLVIAVASVRSRGRQRRARLPPGVRAVQDAI